MLIVYSIERSDFVLLLVGNDLLLELEVRVCDTSLATVFAPRTQAAFQVKLSRVLILCRLWMMNAHDSSRIHSNSIFIFVSKLWIVGCVYRGRCSCSDQLRRMLLVISCFDCQALNAIFNVSSGWRNHRCVICISRGQVRHFQGGNLGQIADNLFVLLTVFHSWSSCS